MNPVRARNLSALGLVALVAVALSGCNYTKMRTDDFLDIWSLGAGFSAESEASWIPPTIGLYAEAGPLALGAITHNGLIAEIDGRGLYAGRETRSRLALLWFHKWRHSQDYDYGYVGFYKDYVRSADWHERMRDMAYIKKIFWPGTVVPAKVLLHEDSEWRFEVFPLKRGWQYWETIAVEIGISDPFITHWGVFLRLGFDPSEILDFLLGFATIDYKRDDYWQRPPRPEPEPQVVIEQVEVPVEVPVVQRTRTFEFSEVLFRLDDASLTDAGERRVDEIQEALGGVEVTAMTIEGHTCDRGTEEYNYELGLARATTVADALANRGFDSGEMEVVSYGETRPRVPNIDEQNRSLNRRVEVRVTYNEPTEQ